MHTTLFSTSIGFQRKNIGTGVYIKNIILNKKSLTDFLACDEM